MVRRTAERTASTDRPALRDTGHTVAFSSEEKRLLKRAAFVSDVSLGRFIREAALDAAAKALRAGLQAA